MADFFGFTAGKDITVDALATVLGVSQDAVKKSILKDEVSMISWQQFVMFLIENSNIRKDLLGYETGDV